MPAPTFDRTDLGHRAVALVLEAAATPGLSGGQKRRRVIAQLAEEFDGRTTFGSGPVGRMLELVDGAAYRIGLTLLVEGIVLGVEAGRAAVRG